MIIMIDHYLVYLYKKLFGNILFHIYIYSIHIINNNIISKLCLRYLWIFEPIIFIALLDTWQMDVQKSEL